MIVMTLRMMSKGVGKADQMVCRDIKIALIDMSLAVKITRAKVCKNYREIRRAKKDQVVKV